MPTENETIKAEWVAAFHAWGDEINDAENAFYFQRPTMRGFRAGYLAALSRLEANQTWRPISEAPKSTSVDTPHGKLVSGIYLLGFCPEDALDPKARIDVIWWEPNEGKSGQWFGGDALPKRPTHFLPLPPPPTGDES